MESIISRYRNTTILVIVLFAQVLGLAVQIKRPGDSGSTTLLRRWVVSTITPIEKGLVASGHAVRGVWTNYIYLRGVRRENRALRDQLEQMRLEQVRLSEDASQARRLQYLLGFKEQFISATVAAQVIGTSGSDLSRVFYIDKGGNAGIKPDMAVINADGIIGKVLRVYGSSAQVLEINDPSSGVGAILEKSRLQGILQGTASGELMMRYVMSDEKVAPGEVVLTSGGDRIFPKGLPIGTVIQSTPGSDLFLNIRVKPAANLSRVEEVLVVTRIVEKAPDLSQPESPQRAADILAQRLPSVPPKPAPGTEAKATPGQSSATATGTKPEKPAVPAVAGTKPAGATAANSVSTGAPGNAKPASTATATAPKPKTTTESTATAATQKPKVITDLPGGVTTSKPAGTAATKPATTSAGTTVLKPATVANPKAAASASAATKPTTTGSAATSSTTAKPVQASAPKPAKPAAASASTDQKTTSPAATPNGKLVENQPAKPSGTDQAPSPQQPGDVVR